MAAERTAHQVTLTLCFLGVHKWIWEGWMGSAHLVCIRCLKVRMLDRGR